MENHKRFLVFAYDKYYANGGLSDVDTSFDDVADAIDYTKTLGCDYIEVYDRIEGVEIAIDLKTRI